VPSREPATVRDLRRGQIVAAARTLVAELGLEALTFAALEQRLAFTRGTITWHFRNKDDIVRAVLEDAIDEIDRSALAAIRAEATLADRARAVVREMVRGWLGSDAGQVLVSFWGRQGTDADAAELNAALYRRYRAYSADLVRIGQQRGEFRADADPEAIAAVFVALVHGIALQALFEDGAIDVDRAVAVAGDAVVALLEAR
jgi:AcrR family transcriptional regulator